MLKYISNKNIENYKYEISALRNEKLKENENSKIIKADHIIRFGKYICRFFLAFELLNLIYKINKKRKVLSFCVLSYLKINAVWIFSNFLVNFYLERFSDLNKIITKYKKDNDQFRFVQYISNRKE